MVRCRTSGTIRDFWLGQDPDDIIQKVLKWLKHVEEKTGRTPIIYTSRGWWNDRIKDEKKFAQLQAAIRFGSPTITDFGSHVNAKPKVPNDHAWTLWQFTETGRMTDVEVMPGRLDVNIFNGSLGRFEEALGVTVPEVKEVVSLQEPKNENKPAEQTTEAKPNEPSDIEQASRTVGGCCSERAHRRGKTARTVSSSRSGSTRGCNKAAGANGYRQSGCAKRRK